MPWEREDTRVLISSFVVSLERLMRTVESASASVMPKAMRARLVCFCAEFDAQAEPLET